VGGAHPVDKKNARRNYMRVPCPYCKGSGKFRHERPPAISDKLWLNIVGQAFACSLCKTLGYVERPLDHLIVDTGLLYVRNNEKRTLVACPETNCVKWVDATEAFSAKDVSGGMTGKSTGVPQNEFAGKCPAGHEVMIEIVPMRKP
jgi:hypothetical protein